MSFENEGYINATRSGVEYSIKHPLAWTIACQIAFSCHFEGDDNPHTLQPGEALLAVSGHKREEYSKARSRLKRDGLASFRKHPLGWVGMLLTDDLFQRTKERLYNNQKELE